MKTRLNDPAADLRSRFLRAVDMPRMLVKQQVASVRDAGSEDARLRCLGQLLGKLAIECLYPNGPEIKCVLQRMFSFTVMWRARLEGGRYAPSNPLGDLLEPVFDERLRQAVLRRKHPSRYLFDMAHPTPDVNRKFRVVFEECGEVAKEADKLEVCSPGARLRLRNELNHVSAVCAAWLEAYEVQS